MHELAYRYTSKETQAQHKLAITLGSGITAGFAAAILSHVCFTVGLHHWDQTNTFFEQPADTLLSQINKGHGPSGPMIKRLYILGKQAGIPGLFAGLGPRMSKLGFSAVIELNRG
jgi:solute carrier family 25 (mitochondrial phosphate transporter), member 3